jgi:soluble epoxide hydrolase / lipid-phosphate phosphatase
VSAAGFLALSYYEPAPTFDLQALNFLNKLTKQDLGYEIFGYWLFLTDADAHKVIEGHVCSNFLITVG